MHPERNLARLGELSAWTYDELTREVGRRFSFFSSRAAVFFAAMVNDLGETVPRPPEIVICRNDVWIRIKLETGELTEQDFHLIKMIDEV